MYKKLQIPAIPPPDGAPSPEIPNPQWCLSLARRSWAVKLNQARQLTPTLVGLIHESQQSRRFPTQLPSGKGGRLRQSTDPGFGLDAGAEQSRDDYVSPAGEEP